MSKVLLFAAIAVAIWWLWRKLQQPEVTARSAEHPVESMVVCAHCGVNQPRSECVEDDGRFYCSEAHRRAAHAEGRDG